MKMNQADIMKDSLEVRPMDHSEFPLVVDYFHSASESYLRGMGVEPSKLPGKKAWLELLLEDLKQPFAQKKFFFLIWLLNGKMAGHSNVNKIIYGQEACMHLHVWDTQLRQQGLGTQWVKLSLPFYFDLLKLERLYCEPYALNPGPNRTLPRAGFAFIEQVETIPGWINFHQPVNRYVMTRKKASE